MNVFKTAALALAASGTILAAAPAVALDLPVSGNRTVAAAGQADEWNQYRDRYDRYDRYDRRDDRRRYRDERVSRNTPVWRGRDGNYNCRKSDGTTGLIIGGAAGALLGREVDGGRNRTLGTVLGAAGGALLGKEIDSNRSCR
jgi:uncharacterized protein YcfJ